MYTELHMNTEIDTCTQKIHTCTELLMITEINRHRNTDIHRDTHAQR